MIDAHCHLDREPLEGQALGVLERASAVGVTQVIVAGVERAGWERQKRLAETHPEVHVAYGLHPWAVAELCEASLPAEIDALAGYLDEGGVAAPVALGELGLDRGRQLKDKNFALQERAFRLQLAMARERELAVVLHVVRAHGRALELVRADGLPRAGGMVHAFSGSPEVAQAWVELGLHVSFSAALARGGSRRMVEAARSVPSERLLCETDAPDQAPSAELKGKNEPANLPLVIDKLAEIRATTAQEMVMVTSRNARRLFKL